jgi:hypothetical protein
MKLKSLRTSIFSVCLHYRQAVASGLEYIRPKSEDLQDHPTIRMHQELSNRCPNHIAPGVNENQESRFALEAALLKLLKRDIADAALDRAFKEALRLLPICPSFMSIAFDDGRLKAWFLPESHVREIR